MLKAELETTMTYDSEEQLVRIFSARAADQGKLRRAGIEPSRGSVKTGFFYKLPLKRLSWRIRKTDGSAKRILAASHPFLQGKTPKTGPSKANPSPA